MTISKLWSESFSFPSLGRGGANLPRLRRRRGGGGKKVTAGKSQCGFGATPGKARARGESKQGGESKARTKTASESKLSWLWLFAWPSP